MMWDVVVEAWLVMLLADDTLKTALGGSHIYPASSSLQLRVPSAQYSLLYDLEGENFNRFGVQLDFWARAGAQARTIERRIRTLTHRDTSRELPIGDPQDNNLLRLWTQYVDSRSHDYPSDAGVIHRSIDFEFETMRSRFHATP